jgi:hypothetical protein
MQHQKIWERALTCRAIGSTGKTAYASATNNTYSNKNTRDKKIKICKLSENPKI